MLRPLALAVLGVGAVAATAAAQLSWPRWLEPRAKDAAGRLSDDVRPTAYAIEFDVDPSVAGFAGSARITVTLERSRDVVWLHALGLDVTTASVDTVGRHIGATPRIDATTGLLGLHLDRRIGPGDATLALSWTAPWATRGPGLRRHGRPPDAYVVANLGAGGARRLFPCFDEPRFVTPFDVRVRTRRGMSVVGNARTFTSTPIEEDRIDVQLARTPPLPTHLLALAIGRFDAIEGPSFRSRLDRTRHPLLRARTLPGQRAVAGRVLGDVAATVGSLENTIGTPPPFDKLDILVGPGVYAVPTLGFAPVPMHPQSPIRRADALARRLALARSVAQGWIHPTVTLGSWNERWLPDALAAWAGTRAVGEAFSTADAEMSAAELTRVVMDGDGLATARAVHDPDQRLREARGGGTILESFRGRAWLDHVERWIGAGPFRTGLRSFLTSPRLATGGPDGLLAALGHAASRDVATPMRTFLDQPGVPLVDVRLACDGRTTRAELRQSRWLPVGSWADPRRRWHIPVCLRSGRHGQAPREHCLVVTEARTTTTLADDGCVDWVMPNASGAGYYRWSLPTVDFGHLLAFGWPALTPRERLNVTDAFVAAFAAGTLPARDLLAAFDVIANDPARAIAAVPMPVIRFTREHLVEPRVRERVDGWGRELYALWWERLGWTARATEEADRTALRPLVIDFLARVVRDPAVRRGAADRGRRLLRLPPGRSDLAPEIAEIALTVVAEQGDATTITQMIDRIARSADAGERARLLRALGATRDPTLATRVRALALDPALRDEERLLPLETQLRDGTTRDAAWTWLVANLAALTPLLPEPEVARLPSLVAEFCDDVRAADVRSWLGPAVERAAGGTAQLERAVETIHLCAARVAAQRASATSYFTM